MTENPFAAAAAARAKAEHLAQLDDADLEAVAAADDAAQEAAEAAARAEEQERAVKAAADAYEALLPEIRAARPQGPREQAVELQLTGAAWVADRVSKVLVPKPGTGISVDARVHGRGVLVTLAFPPHVCEAERLRAGKLAAARLEAQGNLGAFTVQHGEVEGTVLLYRADVETDPWASHGKRAAAFRADREGQRVVFDEAGLVQKNPATGNPQRPLVHSWGEDDRGATAELRLPPAMTLEQVRKAIPGLRQALRAPNLEVSSRGVWPVLHLNTRKLVKAFKAQNPLDASRMYLPQSEAERYACSNEVRLFLGVTEGGDVVAPKLADRSHAAIYGMTNSGKSTLMSVIARSLAAQGAEVWLADGKGTPEFRQLYLDRVPGITHLSVATPATMHATVHKLLELYRFRRDLGDELVQRGVTDIRWTRVVLIWDEMGAFLNSALSDGADPVARKHAEYTVNWLAEVAAKSRAYGVHLLVAGQHVYSAALPSKLRENLSIRVVLGRASDVHIQRLFEEDVRDAAKAAREGIEPGMRGRGIVQADDGGVVQMQAFYNDAAASAALDRAMAGTPRLMRWGHLFPVESDAAGGRGAWQQWGGWEGDAKHELAGTVEDLGTVELDRRNPMTGELEPDPARATWDIASRDYRPGSPPRSKAFKHIN